MKNSKVLSFLSIILLSVTFIGCSIFSDDNDDDGKDLILSGYYWMAGDEESVADDASGRASINIYDLIGSNDTSADYKFSTLMTNSTNKNRVNDYPEKGMKSYYTVTLEDEDTSIAPDAYKSDLLNVYKIKVTSHYPRRKYLFDYYQEEYYILDVDSTDATAGDSDDFWTTADPIVTLNDSGSWEVDSKARDVMELNYQDDSVRYEWIVDDSNGTSDYAHFDEWDGDSYPDSWSPTENTDITDDWWSSKVYYYQHVNEWIGSWYTDNKEVFGVRYYTENTDADGKTYRTAISFERFVSQDTLADISDDNYESIIDEMLFGNLTDADVLAETVIWYKITTKNRKTTKAWSWVSPTFGDPYEIIEVLEYSL